MNKWYPTQPDWLKAQNGRHAGPVDRPRLPDRSGLSDFYGMQCNILLPAPGKDVLYLDGNVYEILAPGTAITRNERETLIWRGLYRARRIMDQPTGI
jgi:hypothetical protein